MEVEERGGKVCALIEKATNSIASEVDRRLLKSIKALVRDSESELRLASQTLMSLMKRDHSQVRFLALLIIDELFMRSKLFRTILVVNLDQLLSLSIGFRRNLPLPAPPAVASLLRSKAIEFLEKWNVSFGIHYRQLRLGFEYLKNILRFQFPNLQENAARAQRERRERENRSKELILNKFEILKVNLPSIKDDIQSTVDEIRECLDIVSSKEEGMLLDTMEDEETEEFRCFELRQIRLDSLKEGEKIHESSENKVVFDTLRELYKLLVTKHLVSLQEWISILIRVDLTDNRFRDSTLKEFIDIRNHLQSVKKMCEETGCALPNTSDQEEEDIWEEGKMEHFQDVNTLTISNQTEDLAIPSTSEVNTETPKCSSKESKSTDSDLTSLRGKLLAEAPVMPWGSFLDNWGSNRAFLANQRGLELKGHWGRVDEDAVIPAEKIAELNLQTSLYKEEPMKIQPCHAPLGNGRLCQRRDLRVCPFHGPIIPRDNSPIGCVNPDVDTAVAERLAKQAVKNIRDKDKEELKTREYKQSLKRAKLVKVREHNDAVLREAGLTSTSRSAAVGEDMVTLDGEKLSAKNKTQTLAAMLRKKVTSKDRISQRLSKSRARDSMGKQQLTLGEGSNYREAFPNQW